MDNKNIKLPEPKYTKIKTVKKTKEKKTIQKTKYLDLLFDDSFISSYFLTIDLKTPKI
jgi:hypothetical protein